MDIQYLKDNNLIIFECISGSRAYGLETPTSDTDIKGVYVLPKDEFYGLEYISQVNNETNDEVYYELGRFIELLYKNNPNMLELLCSPEDTIRIKHDVMDLIDPKLFITKQCKQSFGNFALSQIKKARGLNKKIRNPMEEERKSVLDFCFVHVGSGSVKLKEYLKDRNLDQQNCGLAKISNMKGLYEMYYDSASNFAGIATEDSNEVCLSSIPKGLNAVAVLYFNRDGYSTYCKEYREYWSWVKKRNEERYQSTMNHGKNYDAKNMMHTIRLLQMAVEIGRTNSIQVRRSNRDELLSIKYGEREYDDLMQSADDLTKEMNDAFTNSDLKDQPNWDQCNDLLVKIRKQFYDGHT